MAVQLKAGAWAVEGSALGFLVKKGATGKEEYTFCVATVESGAKDKCAFWESKLKPAGKDASGKSKFRIQGHPEGGFFVVVDDDTFSEVDKDMKERCVWKYRDDVKGKFLTSLAAAPVNAKHFPTDNFSQAVLYKDPKRNEPCSPPTQTIVEACCYVNEPLTEDPIERQKLLAKFYTMESPLYHEMNTALRNDDLNGMRYYSSFIKELRDVFKTDHKDQIIEPYNGKVWRGITFPDPDAALQDFAVGEKFVWSAFTSMTTDRNVAFRFGNVVFEVNCLPPKEAYDGAIAVYAPASVQAFSDFQGEAEILFPPNIQFQVKEVQLPKEGDDSEDAITSPLLICETVAFDSDEGLQEFQNFKKILDDALKSGALDNTPADERAGAVKAGYKRLFDAIDQNKSLTLSKKETRQALTKIQAAVSFAGAAFPGISMPGEGGPAIKKYVNEMFAASDMDGNGTLTFDELLTFIASKAGSAEGMAATFTQMSLQDWTQVKKTLDTIVQAFENNDFTCLP